MVDVLLLIKNSITSFVDNVIEFEFIIELFNFTDTKSEELNPRVWIPFEVKLVETVTFGCALLMDGIIIIPYVSFGLFVSTIIRILVFLGPFADRPW